MLPVAARAGGDARAAVERFRIHRAVRELLEALAADKPLVLVLDDLHWADSGSIELLGALLRRPPAAAVLLAHGRAPAAGRPSGCPPRSSARARAGTLDAPRARRAERRRGRASCSAAGRRADAASTRRAAATRSTSQQLAALSAGPRGARLAARAGRRSSRRCSRRRARGVLEGAAVAGDPFEPELAAAAAGRAPSRAALDALDELLRARPRAPDRRAAPLPLPPPARAQRRLRGGARRAGGSARTSARRRRWPRAAPPPPRAPTTSSTPRATATPRRSRCCARRARRSPQRTPAGAARWFARRAAPAARRRAAPSSASGC